MTLEDLGVFPDLHSTFLLYDELYFEGALKGVEVRWSQRMTLCAGVCVYESGGYCSVRLSEPLLKFRSPKEVRETLLHEMIHAFLFVRKGKTDRTAHGPEFLKHMHRINAETGLNLSVYHAFHEEVDYNRKHIWRCNGPCRERGPRFGWLKRAVNRSPGPHDPWWQGHKQSCGGEYVKVAEPERPKSASNARPVKVDWSVKPTGAPKVKPGIRKSPTQGTTLDAFIRRDQRRPRIPEHVLLRYERLGKTAEASIVNEQ